MLHQAARSNIPDMDTPSASRIEDIEWFHCIDFGDGTVTPGRVDARSRLPALGLPANLTDKTVLDVGAWDGFFSFEAEKRGAERVLATDWYCWSGPGWGTKAGFETARRILGSRVEDLEIDVMDLSPDRIGRFDLVLFLNVLYHLRHPLLALERIYDITGGQLILETHLDAMDDESPVMVFYPDSEMWDDPTTWWGPNPAAVVSMLKDVGFGHVELYSCSSLEQRKARALYLKKTRRIPFEQTVRRGWGVFHARR